MSHLAPKKIHSFANLVGGADKLPYFDAADTMVQADLSAAGRALIDDASAAAQRTTLGLVIGTDVQAYDAELAALAGLASAADKLPYFTGSGTAALADLSIAGRALIDDASAAAQRTTLGLVIGTDVQAFDAQLSDVAGLTPSDNSFIVGNGSNFVAESGATARTSLGVGTGDSPTFTSLTLTGDLNVTGSKVFIGGERTEMADNYVNLNANYTADAAQSCGLVASYDPTTSTNAIAAGGFVAGVASTSNPTVELTAAANVAAGDIIRVQGSTSNDGFYEVDGILATPVRVRIKGIGTVAAVEDWSGNQFTAEAGAGNIYKVNVSVQRCGTDGIWETGKGATVPLTYTDNQGSVVAGAGLTKTGDTIDVVGSGADDGLVINANDIAVDWAVAGSISSVDAGDAAAAGTSGTAARGDHQHAVSTAAPAASGSLAAASAAGSSTGLSRADHVHSTAPSAHGVDFGTGSARWDVFGRTLDFDGSHVLKALSSTAATVNVGADDYIILADPTTQAQTVNLPAAASSSGRVLKIKHSSASANSVTVDANAAELIDGAATQVLSARSSITVVCDGAAWHIL